MLQSRLRLVRAADTSEPPLAPARGDVALLAALVALDAVPIVGQLAHLGRWRSGTVGLATAFALVAGKELWNELRSLFRARTFGPRWLP